MYIYLDNTLPDLELRFEENQEPEMNVTHFRALNDTRRSTKFERINDSTFDTDTDTNE